MQQKKTRRGREYLNDFRRDVNGSYLYQGSYRRYTGSMPYAKLRGLLWALCGGALAALAAAGMVPAPGAMQQFYVLLQKDRANAWEHYMAYTRQGGSRVFTELLKNAGLDSPFEESCLRGVCETAKQWLDNYDLTGIE